MQNLPGERRSARSGGNRDPGLRTARRVRVVSARARAVVPVRLPPGLLLDVDGWLGLDDGRRVVVRRVIPPVRKREEGRDADEHAASVMEMMKARVRTVVTTRGAATPAVAATVAARGVGRSHHHEGDEGRESDAHQTLLHLDCRTPGAGAAFIVRYRARRPVAPATRRSPRCRLTW